MRIAIDAIGIERHGGGRYTALGLITGILQEDHDNRYLIIVSSDEPSLGQFPNAKQRILPETNRLGARFKAQAVLPILLQSEKIDIIHFTKNLGIFFAPCKTLVTVYDMTILNYPEFFPKLDVAYWRTVQRLFFRTVDRIGTLSQNAKRDLVRYYQLPDYKIDVIYSACDPIFRPLPCSKVKETSERYNLTSQYILSVGNVSAKKNFDTLLKAFALLKNEQKLPHKLIVVGGEYWGGSARPLHELLNVLGLQNEVMFLGTVVGEDLVAIYNGAAVFAFPSLDEGFGIVLVEAMACGTPIVASSTSAIPEVVGDAGILLQDPKDHQELARAIAKVINDEGIRGSLVKRGLERAKHFSWRKAGLQYLRLYEELMRT